LYDFYILPAEFCDEILHVRNFGSHTQITKQDETHAICLLCGYTGWPQKHSLVSSIYNIKTYWNIFNKYGTADTLTQEIFIFPPAVRGQ
jgi:hypothetical protein